MRQFWMCYVEGKQTPSRIHPSLEGARKEAERLACQKENLNHRVFTLEASHYCEVSLPPVTWSKCETDILKED